MMRIWGIPARGMRIDLLNTRIQPRTAGRQTARDRRVRPDRPRGGSGRLPRHPHSVVRSPMAGWSGDVPRHLVPTRSLGGHQMVARTENGRAAALITWQSWGGLPGQRHIASQAKDLSRGQAADTRRAEG